MFIARYAFNISVVLVMMLSLDAYTNISDNIKYMYNHATAKIHSVSYSMFAANTTDNIGPIVRLRCTCIGSIPNGTDDELSSLTLTWIYGGKKLAENDVLIEADSSRIDSRFEWHKTTNTLNNFFKIVFLESVLEISNAVKDDEGVYMCREQYNENGHTVTDSRNVSVVITEYLPPLHHPLCSLKPSSMLEEGSDITFHCLVGDSNPGVKLQVTLEKPGGCSTVIGKPVYTENVSVETTVTKYDNNATFVCQMTSDTFPTANGSCSAGPIMLMSSASTTGQQDRNSLGQPSFVSGILIGMLIGSVASSGIIVIYVALRQRSKVKDDQLTIQQQQLISNPQSVDHMTS